MAWGEQMFSPALNYAKPFIFPQLILHIYTHIHTQYIIKIYGLFTAAYLKT